MYGEGELKTVSESWLKTVDLSTTDDPNISAAMGDDEHFCKLVLYQEIQESKVRIWDVVILVPNLLFLLFILARCNRARLKLRATSSPIFLAFYGLVICNIVISLTRCIVSMSVNAAATVGGKADKALWVTVRFFLLSTEMSVVIFGLAFGHLDSRSSIRRVLLATFLIALVFTITQGTLEFVLPDDTFHIPSRDFYVFGHGGMMFWFCSSIVFTVIYLFILILPWTRLRGRLTLPGRPSFYVYVGALATLNLVQSIGAGLLNYTQNPAGLCVVDVTAALYLTFFTPLVYHTFLSDFLGISQPSISFSYNPQVDDAMEEDTVSLPHQQSFSSLRTDSDYIYQVHTPFIHVPLYESLVSKSSPSPKQRSSLYSLASRKDPAKTASTSHLSSQLTLYGTSPDPKDLLSRRRSALKSTPDLGKNTLTMSDSPDDIVDAQKSTPDLNYERTGWISDTDRSVHNLILSPNTASNFIYKPKENDSRSNLFSNSDDVVEANAKIEHGNEDNPVIEINAGEKIVLPELETSLENILNRQETREYDYSLRNFSAEANFIELSSKRVESNDGSPSRDIEMKIDTTNRDYSRDRETNESTKESGGLSDYLRSLKTPNYPSPSKSSLGANNDPQNSSSSE